MASHRKSFDFRTFLEIYLFVLVCEQTGTKLPALLPPFEKAKTTRDEPELFSLVKGLRKRYKILMGSFCKMGSLFIEKWVHFFCKNGFEFNDRMIL